MVLLDAADDSALDNRSPRFVGATQVKMPLFDGFFDLLAQIEGFAETPDEEELPAARLETNVYWGRDMLPSGSHLALLFS